MPWTSKEIEELRLDLVRAMRAAHMTVTELCRRFGISRPTAYKWFERYRTGKLLALTNKSSAPRRKATKISPRWRKRIGLVRRRYPTWGKRKLHWMLQRLFGRTGCPSVTTIGRYLRRWRLAKGRRRVKPGPTVLRPALRKARRCNDVWTVDFKGWFAVGDGTRVDPLTVRDLYSRYGLCIAVLSGGFTVDATKRNFTRIFKKYGLPRCIRCDNGPPFGADGPTNLTRLSAWWVKLGIEVEFTRPAKPCDNGAHEQFHRVYKAEAARNPAFTVAGQQRRSDRWLAHYNDERPHAALQMRTPSSVYRKSSRAMPPKIEHWTYPRGWLRRWVKGNGELSHRGVRRFVGEAFVNDYVGLEPVGPKIWNVHFGRILIGELHEDETGVIRPAQYVRRRRL